MCHIVTFLTCFGVALGLRIDRHLDLEGFSREKLPDVGIKGGDETAERRFLFLSFSQTMGGFW